jgi:TonB family protein
MNQIVKTIPIALSLASVCAFVQDTPTTSPTVYKVCSETQQPPCATMPHAINSPFPDYSDEARDKRAQGTVELSLIVGLDGKPHNIHVVRKLGHGLDEKAMEAVAMWTWEPGTKDGEPVPVQLHITMDFHLYP